MAEQVAEKDSKAFTEMRNEAEESDEEDRPVDADLVWNIMIRHQNKMHRRKAHAWRYIEKMGLLERMCQEYSEPSADNPFPDTYFDVWYEQKNEKKQVGDKVRPSLASHIYTVSFYSEGLKLDYLTGAIYLMLFRPRRRGRNLHLTEEFSKFLLRARESRFSRLQELTSGSKRPTTC